MRETIYKYTHLDQYYLITSYIKKNLSYQPIRLMILSSRILSLSLSLSLCIYIYIYVCVCVCVCVRVCVCLRVFSYTITLYVYANISMDDSKGKLSLALLCIRISNVLDVEYKVFMEL